MSVNQEEIPLKSSTSSSATERERESSAMIYDVSMNTYKQLNISNNDRKTYVVKTVGVNGCDAILVWKVDPETGDDILLTHYPPTAVESHRRVLKEFSPRGDGITKVVYLTMGNEHSEWVIKLKKDIEQTLKVKPEIVSLAGLPTESLRTMQHDSTLYQLCATKGYNGNPNARRVIIPFPDKNRYESQF